MRRKPLCEIRGAQHPKILWRPSKSLKRIIGREVPRMSLSADLAAKSVQAVISAIEIYNKPNFSYREEAFTLLMTNAWELLLKAKWVLDHCENHECLYALVDDNKGGKTPKLNRSGNPLSVGLTYLAAKLVEDNDSGLQRGCHDNILALTEIRDNAAHFLNKDIYLGRRVLEIGTASLRNYLNLAIEWFQLDLSVYNFSLCHFVLPRFRSCRTRYPRRLSQQVQKLLDYLNNLEKTDDDADATQHVAMRIETKFVRAKDATAVTFRYTDNPTAPAVAVREEDFLKIYPLTYDDLTKILRRRYSDFGINREYHKLRQKLQQDRKNSIEFLNLNSPRSSRQRFHNTNIIQEFDKHYHLKSKPPASSKEVVAAAAPPRPVPAT